MRLESHGPIPRVKFMKKEGQKGHDHLCSGEKSRARMTAEAFGG